MKHSYFSEMKWVHPEKSCSWRPSGLHAIEHLKKRHFWVDDSLESTGDAPKEFIHWYRYQTGVRRPKTQNWPLYIAKTGQKFYPNESITEHLLTRIGQCLGFHMAESHLAMVSGQLRFLSKHFHSRTEELIHGAEIFYGYLEDREFVDQIENEKRARSFFTVQFTEQALRNLFPKDYERLFEQFLQMILFDAVIGNNDRHYYNWGVIQSLDRGKPVRFAPIYDTARGLLWNTEDEKVVSLQQDKNQWRAFKAKYLNNSKPKIGWDGSDDLNHFELLERIVQQHLSKQDLKKFLTQENLQTAQNVIDSEFGNLFSPGRKELIKELLQERFNTLIAITQ